MTQGGYLGTGGCKASVGQGWVGARTWDSGRVVRVRWGQGEYLDSSAANRRGKRPSWRSACLAAVLALAGSEPSAAVTRSQVLLGFRVQGLGFGV